MTKTIQSINPFTHEINAEFHLFTHEQIDARVKKAESAFEPWKKLPKSEKKELFLKLAKVFEKNAEEMAKLQTIEMGMLYKESLGGLKNVAALTRWFANNFERILAEEEFESEGVKGKTMYDPLGVIFGVAPWNFPFNQVLRAAIPNIIAWNTVVYKHASNVPMCAKKLEELFLEAGFPEGVYQNLFISSRDTEYVLEKNEIKWVNLTGWEKAWEAIGSFAGKMLKPSVLELGWNDAFIVCDSDNLENIAEEAVKARIANGGQKCNSSKRFIVTNENYEEFKHHFIEKMSSLKIGDPMDPETQIPPLAKESAVDDIGQQVEQTLKEWGKLLTGWKKLDIQWNFYAPTIIEVDETMTSYKEEVFGPVASLIRVDDLDEAIELANDSDYGLCGCVYGDNAEQTLKVAEQIHTGMVFINKPAGSKASLPFGWVKKSWYWKENGPEWLKAFTNKKVIVY